MAEKEASVITGHPQGFSEDAFGPLAIGLLFSVPTYDCLYIKPTTEKPSVTYCGTQPGKNSLP